VADANREGEQNCGDERFHRIDVALLGQGLNPIRLLMQQGMIRGISI
jgi:hypothetical protein